MLSAERANRVKTYLVERGVPASKFKVYGLGPENPIESNATLEGRKKNRRVEIELSLEPHEKGQHLTANLDKTDEGVNEGVKGSSLLLTLSCR